MRYKLTFTNGESAFLIHSTLSPEEISRRKYAFPEDRKFPLTDRAHVMSAIRFFNYVSPAKEEHLARAILKRMRELDISEVKIGKNNRFLKYYRRGHNREL